MSKLITPEHIRARFMVCELDGELVAQVGRVDPENQLVTLVRDQKEFTYTDKEGNSTTVTAEPDTLDFTFKARQFKVYDVETLEIYAWWNTYPKKGTNQ